MKIETKYSIGDKMYLGQEDIERRNLLLEKYR